LIVNYILIRKSDTCINHYIYIYSHALLEILMYCRKLLGDELDTCAIDELQKIENQLERSLSKIRARKVPNSIEFVAKF
jgi:hypothetical protein